ncbi:hypothetical protein HDU76_001456 [Blyttiomyces sp. JEL0837]|nr:hypothetical protein HDU76_001456 [Blyttiomyces sp. JEL0837]
MAARISITYQPPDDEIHGGLKKKQPLDVREVINRLNQRKPVNITPDQIKLVKRQSSEVGGSHDEGPIDSCSFVVIVYLTADSLPRSRRVSVTRGSVVGFTDIISRVNVTYDMEKIMPTNSSIDLTKVGNTSDGTTTPRQMSISGKGAYDDEEDEERGDEVPELGHHEGHAEQPKPAAPVQFLRRLSYQFQGLLSVGPGPPPPPPPESTSRKSIISIPSANNSASSLPTTQQDMTTSGHAIIISSTIQEGEDEEEEEDVGGSGLKKVAHASSLASSDDGEEYKPPPNWKDRSIDIPTPTHPQAPKIQTQQLKRFSVSTGNIMQQHSQDPLRVDSHPHNLNPISSLGDPSRASKSTAALAITIGGHKLTPNDPTSPIQAPSPSNRLRGSTASFVIPPLSPMGTGIPAYPSPKSPTSPHSQLHSGHGTSQFSTQGGGLGAGLSASKFVISRSPSKVNLQNAVGGFAPTTPIVKLSPDSDAGGDNTGGGSKIVSTGDSNGNRSSTSGFGFGLGKVRDGSIGAESIAATGTAARYAEALSHFQKKKEGADGVEQKSTKIKSIGQLVKLASDLKQVGEDASLASELDPSTLQMVISLKKWAQLKKKKKNHDDQLQHAAEEIMTRTACELPRPLRIDLINDAIPVVQQYVSLYQKQIGEKHGITAGAEEHLKKLKSMAQEGGFTLKDMLSPEEESAAANAMTLNAIRRVKSDAQIGSHPSINRSRSLQNSQHSLSNSKSSLQKQHQTFMSQHAHATAIGITGSSQNMHRHSSLTRTSSKLTHGNTHSRKASQDEASVPLSSSGAPMGQQQHSVAKSKHSPSMPPKRLNSIPKLKDPHIRVSTFGRGTQMARELSSRSKPRDDR